MKQDEAKNLFFKLSNSFGGKETEGMALAWIDYLPKQDFAMAKSTVDFFITQSGATFMPSVAQFNARLREIQMQHSLSEASRRDPTACKKCDGLTWEQSGADAFIPCSQCRTVAHERWREGAYAPGVLMYQDELEGPKQSYMVPSKPQYAPQKPVSPERARQWAKHIKAKTGYTFPEEVPIEEVVESKQLPESASVVDVTTGEVSTGENASDDKFFDDYFAEQDSYSEREDLY